MIKYKLDQAHPYYQDVIPQIYNLLQAKYPLARLREVNIYEPEDNDTSMAVALSGGIIQLNGYWFCRNPDHLQDAAKRDVYVPAGDTFIGWHGEMTKEPDHVLVHEFFHILAQNIQDWEQWAVWAWEYATARPELAPTGYALAEPTEMWAEAMAARELGFKFGLLDSLESFLNSRLK